MELAIHPNAKEAFDKKADEIIADVFRRPFQHKGSVAPSGQPDFFVVHGFTDDDIKIITASETTPGGGTVSKYRVINGEKVGLEVEGYRKLRVLSERIQSHQDIGKHISSQLLDNTIFDWLLDRSLGKSDLSLLNYALPKLEQSIRELNTIIPIFGLSTNVPLSCGNTTIIPLDSTFFDWWEKNLPKVPHMNTKAMRERLKVFRKDFQGYAACAMKVIAEERRACEIAMEETENALDLLRIFMKSSLFINVPSFLRSFGSQNLEKEFIFTKGDGELPVWQEGFRQEYEPIIIDEAMINLLQEAGFGVLHKLYLLEKKTEFQKDVITSVLTYSRSLLQKEISGRLIYAFTALDTFLLRDQNENIQQNVADRIAFTISKDMQERIKIRDTVVKAYGFRSRAVHHSKSIQEIETLNEFLSYVFRLYLLLIGRNMKYQTRQEFFNEIEQAKFS